ncbi:MAG TPA: hypothetical protein VJX67_00860, partial [Blastocatellia bacterium]|nr:hypothetical protein [Blastocatellia bacterium]
RLAFHHPETGVWKEFVSGPGPEMAAYLEANGMADWTVSIASIRLADPLAVLDTDSGSQIRHARHPGNHILDLGQAERLGND